MTSFEPFWKRVCFLEQRWVCDDDSQLHWNISRPKIHQKWVCNWPHVPFWVHCKISDRLRRDWVSYEDELAGCGFKPCSTCIHPGEESIVPRCNPIKALISKVCSEVISLKSGLVLDGSMIISRPGSSFYWTLTKLFLLDFVDLNFLKNN